MTFAAAPALSSALALRRSPRAARPAAQESLPAGILLLIRIVAGDEQAVADARAATAEPADVLREASAFYLQQVLFAADASSYRILGVNPGADDEQIREHYRWLARWLHPDRNPDAWEVVYSERVSNAWQNLRTSERRSRYDQSLQQPELPQPVPEPVRPLRVAPLPTAPRAGMAEEYALPSQRMDLRWVPSAVLGALGVAALGVVFLYVLRVRQDAEVTAPAPVVEAVQPARDFEPVQLQPAPAIETVADASPADIQVSPVLTPPPTVEAAPTLAGAEIPPPPLAPLPTPPRKPVASAPVAVVEKPRPEIAAAPPVRTARKAEATAVTRPEPAVHSAPAPVAVVAVEQTPPPPAEPKIRQAEANRFLGTFSRAFEQGDLKQMRNLFAADAQGPSGGLRQILADYDRVFDGSSERSLSVRDVNCFEDGENVTIVAGYDAQVTSRGGKARRTRGDLRLDLRRENDRWRIYRLRHDERPG